MSEGWSYTLSLNMPDPEPALAANPLFSIRTANTGTWNQTAGYNELYTFTAK